MTMVTEVAEWDPLPSAVARRELVPVRVKVHEVRLREKVHEVRLREKVKAAGGRWDPARRVWLVSMEQVLQLGLANRVERDNKSL